MFERGGFRGLPVVVKNLLIINVLVFAISELLPGLELYKYLSAFYFDSPFFKPHQVITHMFMHGGITHLFFNMFALWMFGSALERVWGSRRFLNYYFICGLGSYLLHYLVIYLQVQSLNAELVSSVDVLLIKDQIRGIYLTPTVGASGAIFGLLVGFAFLFPKAELMLIFFPIPIKAKYFVPILIFIELFLARQGFEMDNIAHYAHLGGALFGFILLQYWKKT